MGPTLRCSLIRLNIDEQCFFEENEPYSTLSKYRTAPKLGITFGNYYQIDFNSDRTDYEKAFPTNLGYPTYDESTKANPRVTYNNDEETYVRIYKKDPLYSRIYQE